MTDKHDKLVETVAWGIFASNGNIRFWACDKASADLQAAKTGGDVVGIYPASTVASLTAQRDAALSRATDWKRLYDRAINEANGLTNYVEDRPELRSAERRLDVIYADARALKGQP